MQERAGGGLYFNVLNRFATLAALASKVKALLQVPLTLAAKEIQIILRLFLVHHLLL
jgi:hypothetical protein